MWWIGNFANDVTSASDTTPRVPALLEFHITSRSKLIDEFVGPIPTQVPAPLEILYADLPVIRAGEQVGQHAPGRPGEAGVIDDKLVNNQEPMTPGRPDDGVSHPWHRPR